MRLLNAGAANYGFKMIHTHRHGSGDATVVYVILGILATIIIVGTIAEYLMSRDD